MHTLVYQRFDQIIRVMNQKQVNSIVDENYKKIREQTAKGFMGISDPVIAEEWL